MRLSHIKPECSVASSYQGARVHCTHPFQLGQQLENSPSCNIYTIGIVNSIHVEFFVYFTSIYQLTTAYKHFSRWSSCQGHALQGEAAETEGMKEGFLEEMAFGLMITVGKNPTQQAGTLNPESWQATGGSKAQMINLRERRCAETQYPVQL